MQRVIQKFNLQGVIAELISMGPTRNRREGVPGNETASRNRSPKMEKIENAAPRSADSVRAALASVPGNGQCADCGAPDPDWASLNLVVVVCQRCAGAHRHLGARVSKVRSAALDLDAWTPPVLSLFARVGNERANDMWEARRRDGTVAPKVLRLEAAIREGKDERVVPVRPGGNIPLPSRSRSETTRRRRLRAVTCIVRRA